MQDVKAHCWTRTSIIWVVTGSCRWWSKWLLKISFWTLELEVKFFYCVNHSICCQEKYLLQGGLFILSFFLVYTESSVEGQEGCLRGVLHANLGETVPDCRCLAISRRGGSADEMDTVCPVYWPFIFCSLKTSIQGPVS